MERDNNVHHPKRKLVVIPVVAIFLVVLVMGVSKLLFNSSCAGISFANYSSGVELLVHYFKSESEANRYYKQAGVETYYIVSEDADTELHTTGAWFNNLQAPLVADNVKYAVLPWDAEKSETFWNFIDENDLIVYDKKHGVSDGSVSDNDLDNSYSIYPSTTYEYSWLKTSYSDVEREYIFSHMLLSASVKNCIEKFVLSVKAGDMYSIDYWKNSLVEVTTEFDFGEIPTCVRENLNWPEEINAICGCVDRIKEAANDLDDSSDTSVLQAARTSYEAKLAVIFGLMSEEAKGVVVETNERQPADNSIKTKVTPTYKNGYDTVLGGYYTLLLPASWDGNYVMECTEMPGYGYSTSFYELKDHQAGYGGELFSLILYSTDYDFTQMPDYRYIGELDVYRIGLYNFVATLPTDVQFSEDNIALYQSMMKDVDDIIASITYDSEATLTEKSLPEFNTDNSQTALFENATAEEIAINLVKNCYMVDIGINCRSDATFGDYLTDSSPQNGSMWYAQTGFRAYQECMLVHCNFKVTDSPWYFVLNFVVMDSNVFFDGVDAIYNGTDIGYTDTQILQSISLNLPSDLK